MWLCAGGGRFRRSDSGTSLAGGRGGATSDDGGSGDSGYEEAGPPPSKRVYMGVAAVSHPCPRPQQRCVCVRDVRVPAEPERPVTSAQPVRRQNNSNRHRSDRGRLAVVIIAVLTS